ncbi:MAG: MerR family transcriptional regulator [Acidimicrobiales bacterium]
MDRLLTIGAFAERCGLPRSALRFYDECGLLRPVAVDDVTGYRYYDRSQVGQASLIRRLRATDMPVEKVRAFLAANAEDRRRMLAAHVATVEEHLAGLRAAAAGLFDLDDSGSYGPVCQLPGAVLAEAVGQVVFAAGGGGGDRPELEGVLVEVKRGSLRLVATDSYRLAVRDVVPDSAGGELRGLVAAATLRHLVEEIRSAADCELRPTVDGGLVVRVNGRDEVLAGIPADFPAYEEILEGHESVHHGVLDRRRLAGAVVRGGSGPVTLTVTADGLRLRYSDTETVVACDWDGPERTVTLNGAFLADAVAVQVGPDVVIEIAGSLQPVILRSADTGTLGVWIMPIRTDQE